MAALNRKFDKYSRAGGFTRDFAATDGNLTLITGKTGYTYHVIGITVTFSTSAAQAITFQDTTAVTPIYVAKIPASPGVDTRWQFLFEDIGKALGSGKSLVMAMTAGNAGHVEVTGYFEHD